MPDGVGHLEDTLLGQEALHFVASDDVALLESLDGEVLARVLVLTQYDLAEVTSAQYGDETELVHAHGAILGVAVGLVRRVPVAVEPGQRQSSRPDLVHIMAANLQRQRGLVSRAMAARLPVSGCHFRFVSQISGREFQVQGIQGVERENKSVNESSINVKRLHESINQEQVGDLRQPKSNIIQCYRLRVQGNAKPCQKNQVSGCQVRDYGLGADKSLPRGEREVRDSLTPEQKLVSRAEMISYSLLLVTSKGGSPDKRDCVRARRPPCRRRGGPARV